MKQRDNGVQVHCSLVSKRRKTAETMLLIDRRIQPLKKAIKETKNSMIRLLLLTNKYIIQNLQLFCVTLSEIDWFILFITSCIVLMMHSKQNSIVL